MNRVLIITAIAPIFVLSAAFAQDSPNPIFSSSLVAWTDMQTPQPVPEESFPAPSNPEPQPDARMNPNTPDSSTGPSEPSKAQDDQSKPAARTFTGMVGKEGDTYVLKISGASSYKLDDQEQAKQYAGQRVTVLGTLDEGSAVIHVQKIEPVS